MGKAIIVVVSWLSLWICSLHLMTSQSYINLTFLDSALPKGAVCLDGSPPAYSYTQGSGTGSYSWIVYLQGGGWCDTIDDCQARSVYRNGSSRHFPQNTTFSGLLDLNNSFNPNFYNWHKVYIYYCDGASFMADVQHPVNGLRFRGARIFKVMMEEMMSKGMRNAQNAILTGSSAGGLAATLHCDSFRALFPLTRRVKCISDSGFFLHAEGLPGADGRAQYFARVIALHELNKSLPTSCTNKLMDPSLCLYPENFVGGIKTPLFLLESAFDRNQIQFSLVPAVGGRMAWIDCLNSLTSCNSTELDILRDFRAIFIETLLKLDHSPSRGMFVHSFFRHGHLLGRNGWTCSSASVYGNNMLANKTIGQAISDWYFDRNNFEMIDTQHDIPMSALTSDSHEGDKECAATLSFVKSIASHQIVSIINCVVMQSLITLYVLLEPVEPVDPVRFSKPCLKQQ